MTTRRLAGCHRHVMFHIVEAKSAASRDLAGSPRCIRRRPSRADLVVQVHRVIEVVPGEARETGFLAHPLG
jgi:hypothetical protein